MQRCQGMAAKIRTARKGDLVRLLVLMEQYYKYDRHNFDHDAAKKAMRRLLADRNLGTVLLITEGRAAIGYLVHAFAPRFRCLFRGIFPAGKTRQQMHRGRGIPGCTQTQAQARGNVDGAQTGAAGRAAADHE